MSGFNQESSLDDLKRLLSGSLDASDRARLRSELNDEENDLRIVVDGLRELPTSFLSVVLEHSAEQQESAGGNRVTGLHPTLAASPTDGGEGAAIIAPDVMRQHVAAVVQDHIEGDLPIRQIANRQLIDTVCDRLLGSGQVEIGVRRTFFRMASQSLAEVIVAMARKQAEDGGRVDLRGSARQVDAETGSSNQTTLAESISNPERVLSRDARLRRLRLADAGLADIYMLSTFAGRTHREVAELLSMPLGDVREAIGISQVEVGLDER